MLEASATTRVRDDEEHRCHSSRTGPRLSGYHTVALTIWFLAIVSLIGVRFWSYWSTLKP